jgi:hypothetical protein
MYSVITNRLGSLHDTALSTIEAFNFTRTACRWSVAAALNNLWSSGEVIMLTPYL